jgi:hypothetical protein
LFADAALPKQVHGAKAKVAQDGFFRSEVSCSVKKGCRPLGAGAAPGMQDLLLSRIDTLYDISNSNVNSKNAMTAKKSFRMMQSGTYPVPSYKGFLSCSLRRYFRMS